jgi:CRP/FNR family transcriptional regulator, cyclic AMP receptor protein
MALINTLEKFCYKPISIAKGTILIREGETNDKVYVLISGSLQITTGDVIIGQFTKTGESFGEMAALLKQKASATVEATKDSQIYVIENMEFFLLKNPDECLHLLKQSFERIKQMNKGVNILSKSLTP